MQREDSSSSSSSNCPETISSLVFKYFIGSLLGFIIFFSIAGNVLVCISIYTDRRLRKLENIFLVSLALADLFMASLVMTFAVANDMMGYWAFGPVFCDAWISMDVLSTTASILNLAAISLDRYFHIKDPLLYERWMNRKIIAGSIAIIWLLSAMVSFVPISLGWHRPPTPVAFSTSTSSLTTSFASSAFTSSSSFSSLYSSSSPSSSSSSPSPSSSSSSSALSSILQSTPGSSLPSSMDFLLSHSMMDSPESEKSVARSNFHHLNSPGLTYSQRSSQVSISSSLFPPTSGSSSSPFKMINQSFPPSISLWQVTNDSDESVKLRQQQLQLKFKLQQPEQLSKFILPFAVQSFDSHMNEISTSRRKEESFPSSSSSSSLSSFTTASDQSSQLPQFEAVESEKIQFVSPSASQNSLSSSSSSIEPESKLSYSHGYSSDESDSSPGPFVISQEVQDGPHFAASDVSNLDQQQVQLDQQPQEPGVTSDLTEEDDDDSFDQSLPQCALDLTPVYAVVSSCISFYIPCLIMIGLYTQLYLYARKHVRNIRSMTRSFQVTNATIGDHEAQMSTSLGYNSKNRNDHHNSGGGGSNSHLSQRHQVTEHKAAITLGIIMGTFLFCWVPFFIVNIIGAFCKTCIPPLLFKILTWLGYFNSAMNPVIYSIFNTEFRDAFRRILVSYVRNECCNRDTRRSSRGAHDPLVSNRTSFGAIGGISGGASGSGTGHNANLTTTATHGTLDCHLKSGTLVKSYSDLNTSNVVCGKKFSLSDPRGSSSKSTLLISSNMSTSHQQQQQQQQQRSSTYCTSDEKATTRDEDEDGDGEDDEREIVKDKGYQDKSKRRGSENEKNPQEQQQEQQQQQWTREKGVKEDEDEREEKDQQTTNGQQLDTGCSSSSCTLLLTKEQVPRHLDQTASQLIPSGTSDRNIELSFYPCPCTDHEKTSATSTLAV